MLQRIWTMPIFKVTFNHLGGSSALTVVDMKKKHEYKIVEQEILYPYKVMELQ